MRPAHNQPMARTQSAQPWGSPRKAALIVLSMVVVAIGIASLSPLADLPLSHSLGSGLVLRVIVAFFAFWGLLVVAVVVTSLITEAGPSGKIGLGMFQFDGTSPREHKTAKQLSGLIARTDELINISRGTQQALIEIARQSPAADSTLIEEAERRLATLDLMTAGDPSNQAYSEAYSRLDTSLAKLRSQSLARKAS